MVPALNELAKDIESETVMAEKTFRENLLVSSDNVKHSLYWNIGISVSVITVLLILSVFIIRSITRNLNKILDHTPAPGSLDLTQKIYIDDNDEFAQIATWINQFVDKLNESMSNVSETTRQVDGASLEMVRTNNSITDGSNRQMIEAEQVASAIEQIGTTINEVAANATDVA